MIHRSTLRATAVAVVGLSVATVSFAHHLPRSLSYAQGREILSAVSYYQNELSVGIPPYTAGALELGHHDLIPLADGDRFTVSDNQGGMEVIEFQAGDFADISAAPLDEVLATINGQSTLAGVDEINAFAIFRGFHGGSASELTLNDGPGNPLEKLGLADTTFQGALDVPLEVSLPLGHPGPNLAGNYFVLLVSRFEGTQQLLGKEIPVGFDPRFAGLLARARVAIAIDALFPWLRQGGPAADRNWPVIGRLNQTEDASAVVRKADLDRAVGRIWPDKLHVAGVVLSRDLRRIEFVTNAFTLNVIK